MEFFFFLISLHLQLVSLMNRGGQGLCHVATFPVNGARVTDGTQEKRSSLAMAKLLLC
jgi:hypothetical protein